MGPPQSGPLNLAAAPRAAGRRVCVLVPGADVLLAEPEVPPQGRRQAAQLVPYALEEHLADDIDELHFAIGKRAGGDLARARWRWSPARCWTSGWRRCAPPASSPSALYADSDLLPENPGQAVALLEEDAVFVRPPGGESGDAAGRCARPGARHRRLDADTASGARGLILYTGAAEWQQHSAQVEAARPQFDGIKVQLLTGGPLALFAQQLLAVPPSTSCRATTQPKSGARGGLARVARRRDAARRA